MPRLNAAFFMLFLLAFAAVTAVEAVKIETAERKEPAVTASHALFCELEYEWYSEPFEPGDAEPAETREGDAEELDRDDWDLEGDSDGGSATAGPAPPVSVYPLPPSSIYTYSQMVEKLHLLRDTYPGLINLGSLGSSVEGRPIWSLELGKGPKKVLVVGSCHAREWLTTPLLMRKIETYAQEYCLDGSVDGYAVGPVLDQYTLVFVPMQNPDGVILAQFGLAVVPQQRHEQLLVMKPSRGDNFTLWKANIRGVDLNRQHSAGSNGWSMYRTLNPAAPKAPWYKDYPGSSVESEPESKALADLINQNSFELVLTYHSSGEIFFWYYFQDEFSAGILDRDLKIVNAMAAYSGYRVHPPEALHNRVRNFGAHLTAWVVHDKKIPCITVEIGKFTTGYLNMSDLPGIWARTRALPLVAVRSLPSYRTSFDIVCQVLPAEGGTVTGSGVYNYGEEVTLSAMPAPGYRFTGWTESGTEVTGTLVYTFTVTADRTLTANFAPDDQPGENGGENGGNDGNSGESGDNGNGEEEETP